jgi:predicted transcriptional regulator|tara:strand:+ start:6278 stop:6550 length:273 start_codon:yes stop_codon:yes gene_type:complete
MKISDKKKEKIFEQILALLYSNNLKPLFTYEIAQEIARDEEFIKKLLLELLNKKFVFKIDKNPKGIPYIRRARWKLTNNIYQTYKKHQNL